MLCPKCATVLKIHRIPEGHLYSCSDCGGFATTLGLARRILPVSITKQMWDVSRKIPTEDSSFETKSIRCPECKNTLVGRTLHYDTSSIEIDICYNCQFVWFDPGELERSGFRSGSERGELEYRDSSLDPSVRRDLALIDLELQKELTKSKDLRAEPPQNAVGLVLNFMGFPVESNTTQITLFPIVTGFLIFLMIGAFLLTWNQLPFFIAEYGWIPDQPFRYFGLTLFTSVILHGGFWHLFGNLLFLYIFGDNVEDRLGHFWFLVSFVLAFLCGDICHAIFDPRTNLPCIGASAGISGILTLYALEFPNVRLLFFSRAFRRWYHLPVWLYLLFWIVSQFYLSQLQVMGVTSVSGVAHLGGVLSGLIVWCIYRSRREVVSKLS